MSRSGRIVSPLLVSFALACACSGGSTGGGSGGQGGSSRDNTGGGGSRGGSAAGMTGNATGGKSTGGGSALGGGSGSQGAAGSPAPNGGAGGAPASGQGGQPPVSDPGSGPSAMSGDTGSRDGDKELTWKVAANGQSIDTWMWVPGGVKTVRGIITNVQFGIVYREVARLFNFALMAWTPIEYHDKADWDVAPILQAAKDSAEKFGHPELANAPFLGTGHSIASGTGGLFLIAAAPERLIGAVPGGMGYDFGPPHTVDTTKSVKVPLVLFRGGTGKQPANDGSDGLPVEMEGNRKKHALFAYAVQFEAGHTFGIASNIILPTWQEMIATRLPAGADGGSGPVKLTELSEESGWLGAPDGWKPAKPLLGVERWTTPTIAPYKDYPKDKEQAAWLVNSYAAHVWQAYQAGDDTVKITSPERYDNDAKNAMTMLEPNAKLNVSVEVGETPSPVKSLQLRDGDKPIGNDAGSAPATFSGLTFAPGVHALVAVATLQDGRILTSRPTAILSLRLPCPTPLKDEKLNCVK